MDQLLSLFNTYTAEFPTVWMAIKILLLPIVPLILAVAFYTVTERWVIGWMQVRRGPVYIGKGFLQPFADVFKLLFKEIIVPSKSNLFLFRLAPMLALIPAFAAWAVVPAGEGIVHADVNAGLLYLLAMTSMGVYGIILASLCACHVPQQRHTIPRKLMQVKRMPTVLAAQLRVGSEAGFG